MATDGIPGAPPAAPAAPPFRMFSPHGRIGRLRMIAYPIAVVLILGPLSAMLFAAVGPGAAAIGLVYLALVAMWTVRRVRDFDGPTWLCALFVVTLVVLPIANLILWFVPGSRGENRYGAPPPPNGLGVYAGVFLMPVLLAAVIVAAVFIPVHRHMTERAILWGHLKVAHPHRIALASDCQEGRFGKDISNRGLGLEAPTAYADELVQSIAVIGVSPQVAEIVVTLNAIGRRIEAGQTVVYVATCRPDGVTWRVTGTVPSKLLPRI